MASPVVPRESIREATPDADNRPQKCPLPDGDEDKEECWGWTKSKMESKPRGHVGRCVWQKHWRVYDNALWYYVATARDEVEQRAVGHSQRRRRLSAASRLPRATRVIFWALFWFGSNDGDRDLAFQLLKQLPPTMNCSQLFCWDVPKSLSQPFRI